MALADVRTSLDDRFTAFADWLAGVTVLEWVLLALALAAVLWVVSAVRAATTLGPIEVADVESDDDASAANPLAAYTARLRQRIADVGFRPPSDVPAGAPQANLLSAIEKSPIPQAGWIASLLQAMPRPQPVSYKLRTTLVPGGQEIRYWLCPVGDGEPLIDKAGGGTANALERIPEKILMHISKDAADIFPPWARWDDATALEAYLDGLDALKVHDHTLAAAKFEEAWNDQPENAVARLRMLNSKESLAGTDCVQQAEVLSGYLELVVQRPELVEARFRASTLAATVATGYLKLSAEGKTEVEAKLQMKGATLVKDLRAIGRLGINQALMLLEPWFVPLVWRRPRYAIEPRGRERRRLKHTLEVSKQCQFARRQQP